MEKLLGKYGNCHRKIMFRRLNNILKQYKYWKFKYATQNILYSLTTKEKKRSFGKKNPDKTIYIIRSINDKSPFYNGPTHNLLANYFYVVSHVKYAHDNGFIPVVDQLNYPVYNLVREPINGSKNPWEYFWTQPGGISLEEAYHSKNVVLSKRGWQMQWDMGYAVDNYTNKDMINMYHDIVKQLTLNEHTAKYIELIKKKYFPANGRILGVAVRYGGHSENCYYRGNGHPIQPEIDELIDLVKQRYKEWDMEYIFLTSDGKYTIKMFQNVFDNKLIYIPRMRFKEDIKYNDKFPNPLYVESQINKTALDYLTEMELLSQCDALIGSVTSGLRYAVVWNNMQYAHSDILDRGFFPDDRKR